MSILDLVIPMQMTDLVGLVENLNQLKNWKKQ